jgi:hypothetical protein
LFPRHLIRYYSGLSATIGEPEKFNKWLGSVQEAHGFRHTFIVHPHRYSHLRKFIYVIGPEQKPDIFAGLDVHSSTQRARLIHPIAALSFGARGLPADLALESTDTLGLYDALATCQSQLPNLDIPALAPLAFFQDRTTLLAQIDVIRYETALKNVVVQLMQSAKPDDASAPINKIVKLVEDPVLAKMTAGQLNTVPKKDVFKGTRQLSCERAFVC